MKIRKYLKRIENRGINSVYPPRQKIGAKNHLMSKGGINGTFCNYPPVSLLNHVVNTWGIIAKSAFIPHFIPLTQPAGGKGDKGINTYGFIPYPPTGTRRIS